MRRCRVMRTPAARSAVSKDSVRAVPVGMGCDSKLTSIRKFAVDGWDMPPFMGLTTWAAFVDGKRAEVMVMGDLVLFQDEVNPVMNALFENGIGVTALHNHFFFDEPALDIASHLSAHVLH